MRPVTDEESRAIRGLVSRETGLSFESSGRNRLHAGIEQRALALGLAAPDAYLSLLESPRGQLELPLLLDLITVPETRFFRDRRQFQVLRELVCPALARARRVPGPLRLWSAACATGEEACSLAMTALEALPSWRVEVLGTDISNRSLETARRGWYSAQRLDGVPAAWRDRYFEPAGDGYELGARLQQCLTYRWLNLAAGPLPLEVIGSMDVIFCENVLIYLRADAVQRLVTSLHSVLRDDGWLFLGYSETLWQIASPFSVENLNGAFVYRKTATTAPPLASLRTGRQAGEPPEPPSRPSPAASDRGRAIVASPPVRPHLPAPPVRARARRDRHAAPPLATPAQDAPPRNVDERLQQAQTLADRGELTAAREEVLDLLAGAPLNARAHELLGLLAAQLGRLPDAARSLERSVYLDPSAPLAFYHLGDTYRQLGRDGDARRAYRHTLRLLERLPPGTALGEIAVELIVRACRRHLEQA